MNSVSFLLTIIILCIVQLACFAGIAGMHVWLTRYGVGDPGRLYSPTLTEVLEAVVLTLVLCGSVVFIRFINCILTLNKNMEGAFNRFWSPTIEEIFKFGFVYFIAHRHKEWASRNEIQESDKILDNSNSLYSLSIKQIGVAVLVYNIIIFCLFIYRYTPINYKMHYREFVRLYQMWCEHKSIDEVTENNNTRTEAAMMLAESLNDDKRSLYSKKSSITLTNTPRVISVPSISNSFNSFDMKKLQSNLDMHSDMEPCYNLLDKLYSASPKNTYHLDSESAVVVSIDDIEDENETCAHTRWHTLDSNVQPYDDCYTIRDSLSENSVMELTPDCTSVTYCQSCEKNSNFLEKARNSSLCSKSTWISHFNTLSWLFPFSPLSEFSEEYNESNRVKLNKRKYDPRIKKKLSSYQIRNNSFGDRETMYSSEALLSSYVSPKPSYGSIDLECQTPVIKKTSKTVNERNHILKFQQFAENCFNDGEYVDSIPIDPLFEIFGITTPDFSPFVFSLFFMCRYLFNASSFMIYAYPFLKRSYLHHIYFLAISLSVIKLFNQNYIHNKELRISVQASVMIEGLINLVIFFLSTSLLLFSV